MKLGIFMALFKCYKMNQLETLKKQSIDSYNWVHKLIAPVTDEKWSETPPILESNINWQIGHLVISIYYHSILVIKGHQKDILEKVPLKKYSELYTFNTSPKNSVDSMDPSDLRTHFAIIEKKSLETIDSVSIEELKHELVPGKVEHPVAKTKFEALDWNIKHTMWHCGQLAILKRVLGEAYDFGLKKPN